MAKGKNNDRRGRGPGSWLLNAVVHGLIRAAMWLPYERRVPAAGWVFAHVLAPLAGYRKRIRANLALICPDMDPAEVRRLERAVPDNTGRTMIEIYSGQDYIDRVKHSPLIGAGVPFIEAAQKAGKPMVFVTAHFGNHDVSRVVLLEMGCKLGGLYNPLRNVYFNAHYVQAMETIGTPVFARGRKGLGHLLRFLKAGNMVAFLVDLHVRKAPVLQFFGHPARTALSAAELALKYDAPLIPIYSIRQPDGLSFVIEIEAPVPVSDPETMTQALNDSCEAVVRRHMGQWFWVHRRWKMKPDRVKPD